MNINRMQDKLGQSMRQRPGAILMFVIFFGAFFTSELIPHDAGTKNVNWNRGTRISESYLLTARFQRLRAGYYYHYCTLLVVIIIFCLNYLLQLIWEQLGGLDHKGLDQEVWFRVIELATNADDLPPSQSNSRFQMFLFDSFLASCPLDSADTRRSSMGVSNARSTRCVRQAQFRILQTQILSSTRPPPQLNATTTATATATTKKCTRSSSGGGGGNGYCHRCYLSRLVLVKSP